MSWREKARNCSVLILLAWVALACGVKGDPLPPEKPPELGRGRPTYKRATEGIKIEKTALPDEEEDDEEEEADDGRE